MLSGVQTDQMRRFIFIPSTFACGSEPEVQFTGTAGYQIEAAPRLWETAPKLRGHLFATCDYVDRVISAATGLLSL